MIEPYGCAICGRKNRGHGDIYTRPTGAHKYLVPSEEQIKNRMLINRLERETQ